MGTRASLLASAPTMPPRPATPAAAAADAAHALAAAGHLVDAMARLQAALRAHPLDPVLIAAALALLPRLRRHPATAALPLAIVAALPADPAWLAQQAWRLLQDGETDAACALLDRALDLAPAFSAPGGALAALLRQLDDADTGCAITGALHARHNADLSLLRLHGQWLATAEHRAAATTAFARLADACPNDPYPQVELGRLAMLDDQIERARAHFQAALARDGDCVPALWELTQLDGGTLAPERIAQVQALCASVRDPKALAGLHAIAGRLAAHDGDAPRAARHAGIANTLQAAALPPAQRYQAAAHRAQIEATLRDATPAWMQRLAGAGDADPRPVFIVGLPRSGTTLLERMLAAHPAIAGVGEQAFAIHGLRRALHGVGGRLTDLTAAAVRQAAGWHRQRLDDRLQRLGLDPQAARIVDKMPDNYLLAGWLRIAFPQAAIIHCLRDPRDVAVSCWFTHFAGVPWSCSLEHIAARIEQHRLLLRHWRTLPHMNLLELRYEDLIADPEAQLRALIGALRLPWHAGMTEFTTHAGYVASASHRQVREPLHTRSVGRWRAHRASLQPVLARLDAIAAADAAEWPGIEAATRRSPVADQGVAQ